MMVQFKIVVGIMNGRAPIESGKVLVLFLEFWLIKIIANWLFALSYLPIPNPSIKLILFIQLEDVIPNKLDKFLFHGQNGQV